MDGYALKTGTLAGAVPWTLEVAGRILAGEGGAALPAGQAIRILTGAPIPMGADAIIVSNHGGRQLDGAISSIRALEPIVKAVGDRTEIWLDSGIRSGQDVLKAIALGARGTMIGRPYLYGLGALGQAGVTRALEIIARELDLTMAFCGHTDIREVGRDILLPGSYPR